jgi:hypothetical protein
VLPPAILLGFSVIDDKVADDPLLPARTFSSAIEI